MVRIGNIATAEIKNTFQSVSPLGDEDYTLIESMIPYIKSPSLIYPFVELDETKLFDTLLEGFMAKNSKDGNDLELKKAKKLLNDEIDDVASGNTFSYPNVITGDRLGAMIVLATKYGVSFGRFDLIIAKLSDQYSPSAYENKKNGNKFFRVSIMAGDSQFSSFITNDEEEATEFEGHMGCRLAIVGNWVPNDYIDKEGTEKHGWQIKNYRGSYIIEDIEAGLDNDEPSEL